MILSRADGVATLVRQVDHQEQCRLMADAWGGGGFGRIAHWDSVVLAAGRHDEGWRATDLRADRGASLPEVDFTRIDAAAHCALYEAGIRSVEAADPRAGLLVSMHGQGLHQAHLGLDGPVPDAASLAEPVQAFVRVQEDRQERIADALGNDMELAIWRWDAYRLLQTWDALSLYLIWRGLPDGRTGVLAHAPAEPGGPSVAISLEPLGRRTVRMAPFPFAASEVPLPVLARDVPAPALTSGALLSVALANASERIEEYVVCR